jgi:dTDP-4-amino-4,6-dideoxygalactose transaminase
MTEINIPFAKPIIENEEKNAASKVLDGHILTHGPMCRKFEESFGLFHNNVDAVTLSNCTSAMFLALKSLGIGHGDEVIVPAMTHIATAHCVSHTGAKPVFCDIDYKTGNIDPEKIIPKINKKTKAIIIVHFVGLPADIYPILDSIKGKNIALIEDCAAALGAIYDDKLVGTFGDAGCFSFYPTKHITTMEGGMLISKNKQLTDSIRKLSSFGYTKNLYERSTPGVYDVDMLGYNFRMTEVAAAIGNEQLKKFKIFLARRKSNAEIIRKELSDCKEIDVMPSKIGNSVSSNFCVNIILKTGGDKLRNQLILKLKDNNVGTSVHYPVCLPKSIYYKDKIDDKNNDFKVAEHFAANTISLPCGPHIDKNDSYFIAKTLKTCLKELI